MKDFIPNGTGNSRTLKSALAAATTWEQFRDALIAGTLPIDLGAPQSGGYSQLGTALSKNNILPDTLVAALNTYFESNLPSDPTIADVFTKLAGMSKVKIETGSYVGTNTYGSSNPCSITADFEIKTILIMGVYSTFASNGNYAYLQEMPTDWMTTNYFKLARISIGTTGASSDVRFKRSADGKTIYWYGTTSEQQLNVSGYTYHYVLKG